MAIPNLKYMVAGNGVGGWPVSEPQSMVIPAGTVIDTSLGQWAFLAAVPPPVDAIALTQQTFDYMTSSNGVIGLNHDPNRVGCGPGVISTALDRDVGDWAGGAAAMLWDFQRMDLEGWHPRDAIPQTKELRWQKLFSLGGMDQWYVYKLSVGELPWPSSKNPRQSLAEHLFNDCVAFSPRNRYLTETEFGLFLARRGCEHKSNGKKWTWVFPPLGECRRAWEAEAGAWDWLEPDLGDWGEKG